MIIFVEMSSNCREWTVIFIYYHRSLFKVSTVMSVAFFSPQFSLLTSSYKSKALFCRISATISHLIFLCHKVIFCIINISIR